MVFPANAIEWQVATGKCSAYLICISVQYLLAHFLWSNCATKTAAMHLCRHTTVMPQLGSVHCCRQQCLRLWYVYATCSEDFDVIEGAPKPARGCLCIIGLRASLRLPFLGFCGFTSSRWHFSSYAGFPCYANALPNLWNALPPAIHEPVP
jgi:hypothetical protein